MFTSKTSTFKRSRSPLGLLTSQNPWFLNVELMCPLSAIFKYAFQKATIFPTWDCFALMLWNFSFSSGYRTNAPVKHMLVFNWLHLIITLFRRLSNTARTSPTRMARAAGRLAMNRLSCSLKSWERNITATVHLSDTAVINRHARSSTIAQTTFIQRSVKAHHNPQAACSGTAREHHPSATQALQKVRGNRCLWSIQLYNSNCWHIQHCLCRL